MTWAPTCRLFEKDFRRPHTLTCESMAYLLSASSSGLSASIHFLTSIWPVPSSILSVIFVGCGRTLRTWPTKVIWVTVASSILKSAPAYASSAEMICLMVTGRRDSSW